MSLTDKEIEAGWHKTFSTSNPYCPCNLKSFTKAARWAETALAAPPAAPVAQGLTEEQILHMAEGIKFDDEEGAEKLVAFVRTLLAQAAPIAVTEPLQGTQEPSASAQQADPRLGRLGFAEFCGERQAQDSIRAYLADAWNAGQDFLRTKLADAGVYVLERTDGGWDCAAPAPVGCDLTPRELAKRVAAPACSECGGTGTRDGRDGALIPCLACKPSASPAVLTDELYVEAAREADQLGEVCYFSEYDPDKGRVPEHFKPRYMPFAKALLALAASPADQVEDARDAKRYRWLCAGNGYFMEENGLCGHRNEKAEADAAIDAAMSATPPAAEADTTRT